MTRALPVLLMLPAVACAPQNAKLTEGSVTAFLATAGLSARKNVLDFESSQWDDYYTVDCREFASAKNDKENEQLRLDGRLKICDGESDLWPPAHEAWVTNDGFHVLTDSLDPWRGEAIITSEGDFQIGFHHRLPGGADLRWSFTIDPVFQPRECVQNDDGTVQYEDIDGDWVENWSNDVESGTLYYLNQGAYQFDPSLVPVTVNDDPDYDFWPLPDEWEAGTGDGKFAEDLFAHRAPYYAMPAAYGSYDPLIGTYDFLRSDLFFCDVGDGDGCVDETLAELEFAKTGTEDEFAMLGLEGYEVRYHDNLWRESDGRREGLDDWMELHYSWVRFDEGSALEVGGSASGDFQIVYEAFDSHTHVFVKGSFDVPRIKKDVWTTKYLPDIKLAENETVLCGEDYGAE